MLWPCFCKLHIPILKRPIFKKSPTFGVKRLHRIPVLFFTISGVHVLLVSLLVDQLSGLFLIFWSTKKNCLVSWDRTKNFLVSLWIFFGSVSLIEGEQKNQRLTKIFLSGLWDWTIFFGQPKKWEIDWTIGWRRDWPKVHGRRYFLIKWSLRKLQLEKIMLNFKFVDMEDN